MAVRMGAGMKIRNENNKIWLCDESGASCMLMQKPEIEDYGNLSKRALVTNYHLKEETIWERFCSLAFELQDECAESGYLTCYLLLFAELFYVFIGNGQMKNIICYGMEEDGSAAAFQEFAAFTQEGSSFIALPGNSFVRSTLLNKSCQAAVVCMDVCSEIRTLCDVISKVKKGGRLLLYTKQGELPAVFSALPGLSEKRAFGDGAVWSVPVGDALLAYAQENDSESVILPSLNRLFQQFEELEQLLKMTEDNAGARPEVYLRVVELLWEMEEVFLALFHVLDNPKLPVLANGLRESAMDCYIGSFYQNGMESYLDRFRKETELFREAMGVEFG